MKAGNNTKKNHNSSWLGWAQYQQTHWRIWK